MLKQAVCADRQAIAEEMGSLAASLQGLAAPVPAGPKLQQQLSTGKAATGSAEQPGSSAVP